MSVDKPQFEAVQPREEWLRKATTLSEALPFMRRYAGATFVIKYGGHAMGDAELANLFARDVVLLKQIGINPIYANYYFKGLDTSNSLNVNVNPAFLALAHNDDEDTLV